MALLAPFRALRPEPGAAARVAAVPYDVVSTDEARALAAGHPLSFLHVSRAEIDLPAGTSPYADEVYERAVRNFAFLKAAAPLVLEDEPSLYVYRLQMGPHVQTGVAGCFSIDEYEGGGILRHEHTRRDKEDDRTRHLLALHAQTGPVFLTHRAAPAVRAVVQRATVNRPLFDFTAGDGVRHTVWRVEAHDERALVQAFEAVSPLYIADGHHRAASAARARRQLADEAGAPGEWDTFLAVAFPDDEMQILPYNRVVRDLGRFTAAAFLTRLQQHFPVSDGPATPKQRGDVSMFLDGRWLTLSLGAPAAALDPAERLDVSRLQENVLGPLLGIGDPRSDKRIDFIGGGRGTDALEERVRSGEAAVAFSMYPVSIGDLMAISDAGGIMPPKSTWFEPKLRDGLLSHVL